MAKLARPNPISHPMTGFDGKDPVEVVALLRDRLAKLHIRHQEALGHPKQATFDCVFHDGTRLDVRSDANGVDLPLLARDAYENATGTLLEEGSLIATRRDGVVTIRFTYDNE